ncbi:MAG: hypothetical protein ACYTKD_04710 [Planctomycetota bacterium]|jgi:hypothetical protein
MRERACIARSIERSRARAGIRRLVSRSRAALIVAAVAAALALWGFASLWRGLSDAARIAPAVLAGVAALAAIALPGLRLRPLLPRTIALAALAACAVDLWPPLAGFVRVEIPDAGKERDEALAALREACASCPRIEVRAICEEREGPEPPVVATIYDGDHIRDIIARIELKENERGTSWICSCGGEFFLTFHNADKPLIVSVHHLKSLRCRLWKSDFDMTPRCGAFIRGLLAGIELKDPKGRRFFGLHQDDEP